MLFNVDKTLFCNNTGNWNESKVCYDILFQVWHKVKQPLAINGLLQYF